MSRVLLLWYSQVKTKCEIVIKEIRNVTPMKVKMLIGSFFLVKGLIFNFLTQPWTVLPKVKKSSKLVKYNYSFSDYNLQRNLKSYSSVLYRMVMDIYLEHLTISKNNQSYITPEKRIKLRKEPLIAFPIDGTFI